MTLHIHLQDAGQQPVTRVAVCIWQHDTHGGPDSFLDNDLDIFANMGGLQISDAEGRVRFRTGYPLRYEDEQAPIYLQLYFNDGEQFQARSDVCLLMPERGSGPLQDILLAMPAPQGLSRPRFSEVATLVHPERLRIDEALGGLHADVALHLDI